MRYLIEEEAINTMNPNKKYLLWECLRISGIYRKCCELMRGSMAFVINKRTSVVLQKIVPKIH